MTAFISLKLDISREGLKINGKDYKANIQFDNNEIIVCDETKENADWLNDLFDNAQDLKKYIVVYQAKKYELLPESLITLIIFKLKNQLSGIIKSISFITLFNSFLNLYTMIVSNVSAKTSYFLS